MPLTEGKKHEFSPTDLSAQWERDPEVSQSPSQPCLQLPEVWVVGESLDAPLFKPPWG